MGTGLEAFLAAQGLSVADLAANRTGRLSPTQLARLRRESSIVIGMLVGLASLGVVFPIGFAAAGIRDAIVWVLFPLLFLVIALPLLLWQLSVRAKLATRSLAVSEGVPDAIGMMRAGIMFLRVSGQRFYLKGETIERLVPLLSGQPTLRLYLVAGSMGTVVAIEPIADVSPEAATAAAPPPPAANWPPT